MISPITDSSLDSELSRVSHGSSSGNHDNIVGTQGCHAAIRQLSHINTIASGREASFIAYQIVQREEQSSNQKAWMAETAAFWGFVVETQAAFA